MWPREKSQWLEEETAPEEEPAQERMVFEFGSPEPRKGHVLPIDAPPGQEATSTEKSMHGDARFRRRMLHKKKRRRVRYPSQISKQSRSSMQVLPPAREHNPEAIPPPIYPFRGPDLDAFLRPDPEDLLSEQDSEDTVPVLFHQAPENSDVSRAEEWPDRPSSPVPVLVYNDPRTPALVRKPDATQDIEAQAVLKKKKKNELNLRNLLKMATAADPGELLNAKRENRGPRWKGPKRMLLGFVGISLVIVALVLSLDPPWGQQ